MAASIVGCDLGAEAPLSLESPLTVISSVPALVDGGRGVLPMNTPIEVTFDKLLSPSTITHESFRLTSGNLGVFIGLTYDPVHRRVSVGFRPGSLRADLEYVFTVSNPLRGWDGTALSQPYSVRFRVSAPVTLEPPTPPSFREVSALFARHCINGNCHGGPTPALGLDLSSDTAIRRTLLGVSSIERPGPVSANTDPHWSSLVRVDTGVVPGLGRPGYSYLVYKLLGDGPIIGERMPRLAQPLSLEELSLISSWIAAGARVP